MPTKTHDITNLTQMAASGGQLTHPDKHPAIANPQATTRQWCGKEYRYSTRAHSWQVKDARRGTWKKLTNQYIIAALEL